MNESSTHPSYNHHMRASVSPHTIA
jgi:hypothetical protein